jgi:hypothetical protein
MSCPCGMCSLARKVSKPTLRERCAWRFPQKPCVRYISPFAPLSLLLLYVSQSFENPTGQNKKLDMAQIIWRVQIFF